MRLPNIEKFKKGQRVDKRRIGYLPPLERNVSIVSDREKIKVIKQIERMVRGSMEYRQYVKYLKDNLDMTHCAFFSGVTNKDGQKVSLEIHHEPFTLFDITQTVLEKHIMEVDRIDLFDISEEIMQLHYQNKVGLIPLSLTVHQLVHSGKIFVPLDWLKGDYISFLEMYDGYIPDDVHSMLETKLTMTKDLQDHSILETQFVYLEVDGFQMPQILDESYSRTRE